MVGPGVSVKFCCGGISRASFVGPRFRSKGDESKPLISPIVRFPGHAKRSSTHWNFWKKKDIWYPKLLVQ